ncbi:MAG: ThiF family adenylyltransferase [Candidatus Bathyarchaeia archaeon]
MKAKATMPSVKSIELELSSIKNLTELKKFICKKFEIEPKLTNLILDGKKLDEKTSIEEIQKSSKEILVDYLWARHLILWGKEGQSKIKNANVLLAGAGALSNEAAKNLAMLGVKNLTIVDYDKVELSNTSRMIFFESKDLGKFKAESLANNLANKFPYVKVNFFNTRLEELPISVYLNADVIVSGLDNLVSRMFLSSICTRYGIPLVDAGLIGHQARVQVYLPPDWPCPICQLSSSKYGELVNLKNPCDPQIEENKIPMLTTTSSLASSIQAHETMKLILGYEDYLKTHRWPESIGKPLEGIFLIDLKYNRYSIVDLKKNEKCIVCGKDGIGKDKVSRIELKINKEIDYSSLKELIESKINEKMEILHLFEIDKNKLKKMDKNMLKIKGLKPGTLIQVILKNKKEEYKEVVARIIK